MSKKNFAVIGLGQFGLALTKELLKNNANVLVLDINEEKIQNISNIATYAAVLDSTNEVALDEVGIRSIDVVIVAIGENVQASILTTAILNDLGVKHIIVKVDTDYHSKVVKNLGATQIIRPEDVTGKRLARRLVTSNLADLIDLSEDFSLIEVVIEKVIGKTLMDLPLRVKYNVNVVALRRDNEITIPDANDPFRKGDLAIVVGKNADLKKVSDIL